MCFRIERNLDIILSSLIFNVVSKQRHREIVVEPGLGFRTLTPTSGNFQIYNVFFFFNVIISIKIMLGKPLTNTFHLGQAR